jgi:hypothetical protein
MIKAKLMVKKDIRYFDKVSYIVGGKILGNL